MGLNADTVHARHREGISSNQGAKNVQPHLRSDQRTRRSQNINGNQKTNMSKTPKIVQNARINLDTPLDNTTSFAFQNEIDTKDIKVTLANGAIYEAAEKTTFESLGL